MSVAVMTFHGDEYGSRGDFPRIVADIKDLKVTVSPHLDDSRVPYDVFQSHFNVSVMAEPSVALAPGEGVCEVTCPVPVYLHLRPLFSMMNIASLSPSPVTSGTTGFLVSACS